MARIMRWVLLGLLAIAGLVQAQGAGKSAGDKLYLLNWAEYMSPKVIAAFESQCHCQVVQSYFTSLGELLAKLKAGGTSQYDVVVPSEYIIKRMVQEKLLARLDKARIPNLKNLMPTFAADPSGLNGDYAVPYLWGTTGIAYDDRKIQLPAGTEPSWAILFDPKVNPEYPFAVMGGSGMETVGAACAYINLGYGCTGKEAWLKAAQLVRDTKSRKNMVGFQDGTPAIHQLENGTLAAAMVYNGDFAFFQAQNPKLYEHLRFVLPKEGANIWVDNMAVPIRAPHPELAMAFINHVLDARQGAELANFTHYATPNAAAQPFLGEALRSPLITPNEEEWRRLFHLPQLVGGELKLYNQIWGAVQAQ
jgi:spermidine/putrescine transport system substrate-binding protein